MTASKMNLYEKIIVPVAVTGIIGGFGMGLAAMKQWHETSVVLKEVVATQKEIKRMVYQHETDIAILNDREERE
jgi:hypothetical protein